MLEWLKNITKETPEFWKNYLGKFDKKTERRFVVFSTETTGTDPEKDKVLSIGALAIIDNKIIVKDAFEIQIDPEKNITDITPLSPIGTKVSEPEALKEFVDYIGKAILVGHRINFDIEIINEGLLKLNCGKLKNEALDIEIMYKKWKQLTDERQLTLEELSNAFKMIKSERHSASNDAYTIALLFLRLKSRLDLLN